MQFMVLALKRPTREIRETMKVARNKNTTQNLSLFIESVNAVCCRDNVHGNKQKKNLYVHCIANFIQCPLCWVVSNTLLDLYLVLCLVYTTSYVIASPL